MIEGSTMQHLDKVGYQLKLLKKNQLAVKGTKYWYKMRKILVKTSNTNPSLVSLVELFIGGVK